MSTNQKKEMSKTPLTTVASALELGHRVTERIESYHREQRGYLAAERLNADILERLQASAKFGL